jgi:hypothetical protein
MKKNYAILILLSFLFTSCYTARKYPYTLSEHNKAIIKQLFTNGTVSCAPDGEYCWTIKNERTDNDGYYINGTRYLDIKITLKAIQTKKKPESFVTYIRITNVLLPQFKLQKLFLKELENNLFNEIKKDTEKRSG